MNANHGVGMSLTAEGRYRLLVESIADYAIYMLDPDGIVASWNAGAERFKGYSRNEIIGQHFSRFYTEEDRASGLPARALEAAATVGRFEGEGWHVRKDGARFWAHVVVDPIRSKTGEIIGYAKITRDLTEQKEAARALRKSEEEFRLLVQSVTDYAIFMLDPSGVVTSWNAGAERIKGYRPDEIIGQHFSRFYTSDDRDGGEPRNALDTAVREGRFEKEGLRVRKDGTEFWANVVIDPIRHVDGTLLGFAKVTRDITEKRSAQLALDKAREALLQSQKMEAIGQLTGGMAHDFNNLLMAILGSLDLLRKRIPADPKAVRLLDNATQGALRGASLTQRMLAFARRQELKMESVDVPGLVQETVELLGRTLDPNISLQRQFPLRLAGAQTDGNQLESALINLVVNARDAMPGGGVVLISAREEAVEAGQRPGIEPGQYVVIAVSDTGTGMDKPTLARVTEPFFTTKGPGKGTGLGLAMVRGFAEQSGGGLVIESEIGVGTTVEVWLPAAGSTQGMAEHGADPQSKADREQLSVLAVDDDPLVLMNTVAMLEELGHSVIEALSGTQAVELLAPGAIDLVVTDQAMPGMTGLQLVEAIRRIDPDIPAIVTTGYAELPPAADGSLIMLGKPFREQDLARAIERVRTGNKSPG